MHIFLLYIDDQGNPAIWLGHSILVYKLWSRIFPDMGLALEKREL